MRINIPVTDENYFLKVLTLLNDIPPFNKLRPRELELYSHLLRLNHKYRKIPVDQRNHLIFNFGSRIEIAQMMGVKMAGLYNLIRGLINHGIIKKGELIPKYTFLKPSMIIFNFTDEGNE